LTHCPYALPLLPFAAAVMCLPAVAVRFVSAAAVRSSLYLLLLLVPLLLIAVCAG
jgi:hypothetical protein